MEVFKKTIATVFTGERRYVIPLFQRPYVWSRERQWQPLWEDIASKAESELVRRESDPEPPPHFLGAIVIQQAKSWGDALLAHDVIDGQQRLTTFQILLTALRDWAVTNSDKVVAQWSTALTRNANPISDPDVEQFKLWPTERDVEQYRLVSTAESRDQLHKLHPVVVKRRRVQPRPRMVEAYTYFYDAIEEWLAEGGVDNSALRLKALRRVLDRRMHLVSIELEASEDPQAIFETLNARGVPLLASDLLRNYIFQRAGKDARRLHETYWARFERPDDEAVPEGPRFWEVEERQGRLQRARLDLLVHHYLSMKTGTEVLSGQLFASYKHWIEDAKPFTSIEAELRELARFSDYFHALLRPEPSAALGRFAKRVRAVDTSTAYPLVLGMLGNDKLPAADRFGILVDIESFLIRRLVCGRPTKAYNRYFLQLLRDFEAGGKWSRSAFSILLAAGAGENLDWPDDAAFEKGWLSVDAYKDLKAGRCEMILRAIDESLRTAKSEVVTIQDKLSVEHVMPQTWQAHWPLPAGTPEAKATETRDDLVHDFGNLTLLTQALNSAVSNGPADNKLREITKHTALRLNEHFQHRTTWTEDDIRARGRKLFEAAKNVWPRP